MPRLLLAALALAAFAVLPTDRGLRADDACQFLQNMPSEEELIDCLAGPPRVRGIRRVDDEAAAEQPERQANLMVTFEFDSDELTQEARGFLDALGGALQAHSLRGARFMIEGHTDAIGSVDYNQELSERRAQAVYRYLRERFGIEADRLQTVGRGPHDLYDPSDPAADVNRRVRIVNVGEG
jgi:outer membrane protein OmpA-like peptidoglycan-associated protein